MALLGGADVAQMAGTGPANRSRTGPRLAREMAPHGPLPLARGPGRCGETAADPVDKAVGEASSSPDKASC